MKTKKLAFLALFMSLLGMGTVFWNEAPQLTDVRLRFCNDEEVVGGTKQLQMQTKPETPNQICMYLFNTTNQPLEVNVNFVDGTITNDSAKNKACKNEDEKSSFGKYVRFISSETGANEALSGGIQALFGEGESIKTFFIPPQSVIQEFATVNLPSGYAGKIYWCATLTLKEEKSESENAEIFQILNRLGYPIEMVVEGEIITDLTLVNPLENLNSFDLWKTILFKNETFLITETDEGEIYLAFGLRNNWNIPQEADYVLKSDKWSLSEELTGNSLVPPQDLRIFSHQLNQQWYDILMDLDLQVKHKAVFDFESEMITEEMKNEKEIKKTEAMIWIFSSTSLQYGGILAWGLLILISILLAFRRKKKNGTVEKQNKKPVATPRKSVNPYQKKLSSQQTKRFMSKKK